MTEMTTWQYYRGLLDSISSKLEEIHHYNAAATEFCRRETQPYSFTAVNDLHMIDSGSPVLEFNTQQGNYISYRMADAGKCLDKIVALGKETGLNIEKTQRLHEPNNWKEQRTENVLVITVSKPGEPVDPNFNGASLEQFNTALSKMVHEVKLAAAEKIFTNGLDRCSPKPGSTGKLPTEAERIEWLQTLLKSIGGPLGSNLLGALDEYKEHEQGKANSPD